MTPEEYEQAREGYDYVDTVTAGRRCALAWAPWMGDWFTSSSPRNSNSHAEGPWAHWVDLALGILQDPMTAKVHPEAAAAVQHLTRHGEDRAQLSDDDLQQRFVPRGEDPR